VITKYQQSAELFCHSAVEVKWYYKSKELPSNVMLYSAVARSDDHRLVILALDASTEGPYQCMGQSSHSDKYSYFYSESVVTIG